MVKLALSIPINKLFSLEELFSFAKQAGFDGVEYLATLTDWVRSPKKILNLSKKYNVPIISMHQPIYSIFYSPGFLVSTMVSLARFFPDVKITNQHVSAFINPLGKNVEAMKKFVLLAKQKNIQVSFESNPFRPYFRSYPSVTMDAMLFENFSKENNLPITMDTSHIADVGEHIVDFFHRNYQRIKLIHLSDYKNGKEHLPLGSGVLPLKEFFQEIKKSKWNGQISFEIGNLRQLSDKEKLKAIQKSLLFVRKHIT